MRLGFVGAGLRRLAGGLTGEINIGLGLGLGMGMGMGMGSASGGDGLGRAGRMAGIADGGQCLGWRGEPD